MRRTIRWLVNGAFRAPSVPNAQDINAMFVFNNLVNDAVQMRLLSVNDLMGTLVFAGHLSHVRRCRQARDRAV